MLPGNAGASFAIVGGMWMRDLGAQSGPRLSERDMAITMRGTFTLASVGDLIIRRPASQFADAGCRRRSG
jgi:hypothetical protein